MTEPEPQPEPDFPFEPLAPPEPQLGEPAELSEPEGQPLDPPEPLEHNPDGIRWERHTNSPKRDREADREVRRAIQAEQSGEWDTDGTLRPSTWRQA